ncbi:hypothetical protein [Sphingomonas oligoaromativorans]|uniref:hypothetical protein n=1 Tax=Sphingomonas oligoaromativorans TaxID=575322 RepID=UPI001420DA65|nr:hypothetical protein [Sphingomonas oligoaromativorans]NIJ32039.1 hypothetical protein [Sphingomonas oligoaromativorans]
MNRGAYWAGTPLQSDDQESVAAPVSSHADSMPGIAQADLADEEAIGPPPATTAEKVVLALFGVAAFAWIATVVGLALNGLGSGPVALGDVARGISMATGPLALIVALLILWQRNSAREAQRFADVARSVRMESLALDAVLGLASRRLAEDRLAVAEQADRLLLLADQTSVKLREATTDIAREIAELGRQTRDLDAAAGTARVDMGVLLADLPRAEEQTRSLAERIRTAGVGAHEQAAALDATLANLTARAKDAEDGTSGAANRLSAQISQISGASEVAARGIEDASNRMTSSVDGVLERATAAVERTREGIIAQGEAINAMIDRAQTSAEAAAQQAADALARQDGLGSSMIERIQRGLAHVEARFAELDETGRARTERLGDALGQLGGHIERVMASLNDGGTAATTFINRAETLRGAIAACVTELGETLPAALSELESQAARSRELVASAGPEAERLNEAARAASTALDAARTALDERRAAIDTLAEAIDQRLAAARDGTTTLGEAITQVDREAVKLADATSPKLVEALIRVRETATQAAERAREALGTIIPRSAEALGDAGRKALEQAVVDQVDGQIARVAAVSEAAVEAARSATARLEEQLGRIAETSASVDTQIAEGKSTVENADRDNFSRRVALLIDSLNSTAIDVTKLLSNEASDSAWASYLRGDRGVFTRRAVKLIENGEAREIARHYEEDPEFREQVNRYIHDFEALLRPILTTRDGSTHAVIMLSSDMGKLYVALAQAIARLRS